VAGGRVVVEDAVTELPGGPIIDTPKDRQRRELLIPAFVVEAVRHYLATMPNDPEVFVFPGRQEHTKARQQSYSGFRRRFRLAIAAAGLSDVTPHDLRATHASWVADSRGVLAAARRLGHANASGTTRITPGRWTSGTRRSPSISTRWARSLHRARNGHGSPERGTHDR
jgi:integrase